MPRNVLLVAIAMTSAAPLAAQSTGTPVFAAPYRAFSSSEIAGSLSDPGPGFAIEGSYRISFGPTIDGGIRAGLADGKGRNAALLAGVDGRARVLDHTEALPVDGSFTFGFGVNTSGDGTVAMLPIGFSMGRRVLIDGSNLSLVPYVHPVLTPLFGDADGVDFSIGFGVDLRLNQNIDLRFSAAIGDRDGIGFTVAYLR